MPLQNLYWTDIGSSDVFIFSPSFSMSLFFVPFFGETFSTYSSNHISVFSLLYSAHFIFIALSPCVVDTKYYLSEAINL